METQEQWTIMVVAEYINISSNIITMGNYLHWLPTLITYVRSETV